MDSNSWKSESVTIVGSSCRLPGSATSPSKLWDLPKNPTDVSSQISSTEGFSTTDLYHKDEDYHGSTNVEYAYLCEVDYRTFDHDFFSIRPREAEVMDP
ncbi:hypothetical protein F5X98DRAFT_379578 [Xylaria grammica]|nr:hypothetical protein F5X98DRAFT_379578 [Xylaria grammica]